MSKRGYSFGSWIDPLVSCSYYCFGFDFLDDSHTLSFVLLFQKCAAYRNPKNRTTVRAASSYPWVKDAPGAELEKEVERKAVKFLEVDV